MEIKGYGALIRDIILVAGIIILIITVYNDRQTEAVVVVQKADCPEAAASALPERAAVPVPQLATQPVGAPEPGLVVLPEDLPSNQTQ